MDNILLSRKQTAAALDVSLRTLDKLVAAKHLRPIRVGAKVLFRRTALEAFSKKDHVMN